MIFFRGFFTNMNNNKKWCLKLFFQLWICEAVCRIQTLSDQYSKKDILATQLNQILERKLANDRDKGLRMYPSFTFPFSTRDWENNSKGEMFNSLRSGRCLYDDKRLCDPQTSLFSIGKFIEDCNRVTREQKCSTITQNVTVGTLIEVCKIPLVNSCSINQTIAYGLKGCRIEYEDVCKTILKDTEVEEDIVKCKNEEKKQKVLFYVLHKSVSLNLERRSVNSLTNQKYKRLRGVSAGLYLDLNAVFYKISTNNQLVN
ncbi:uncharacterized protein LOC111700552 isoform X2 [Eurytemora carolleeae]|uniref:uncharacterized protein LOC111700552 isoform X2 n=1 Tax=Eurytemora carolleeae TaxID=1294199 RepID=UPI000C75B230|nr:uncharacterized protein LOC111700552 isoform X2 [Eurytemora carolleeae]|eukprot:XP_023327291.1 uncharacterized protein LOC111700552 isoform X2 [Eurytemora affinis]